jgi:hypothetical protein
VTVILTYDNIFSRVRISVTGLDVTTDEVLIERSVNQVNWSTVRGGSGLIPTSNAVQLDDYEFSANVVNYYRATAIDTTASSFVTGGPPVSGNNASLVATMPLGLQNQDLVLILASIRNSGTGAPNQPAGWTTVVDMSNVRMFGKIVTGAEAAPTVTFNNGVANADTLVQTAAFRRTSLITGGVTSLFSPGQQDVPRPSMTVPADGMVAIFADWKQDDWISIDVGPSGESFAMIGQVISTAGDDAAQHWSYRVYPTKKNLSSSTAVVTGGAPAISHSASVTFYHADLTLSTEIESITPTITDVWLKDITKPFLNRTLGCIPNQSPITRRARNGIFPIVGRTFPVAVSDVRLAREVAIEVITQTLVEWQELDLIMATGDVFFIQTPPDNPLPTMYVVVQDTSMRRPLRQRQCDNDWRVFTLPLVEVAAPSANVTGSLGTWQTVLNTYATWADVLAAHSTWSSLLTLIGSTDEIIVS